MTWADGIIAAFDIETTGLDPELDEIVQAAIVVVDGAGQLLPQSWSTIVNPGFPIPAESTIVHGITDEQAVQEGMPAEEASIEILKRLAAVAGRGIPVVIYNAPFDLGFMQVRAQRRHAALPGLSVIDPLVCDRALDRYRNGSRTLASVAAEYGCAAEKLHDATRDAAVSVAVARAMARRHSEMAQSSLADLGRKQRGWHAEWIESFAAYQRQNGRDTSGIERGWPVPDRLLANPSVAASATASVSLSSVSWQRTATPPLSSIPRQPATARPLSGASSQPAVTRPLSGVPWQPAMLSTASSQPAATRPLSSVPWQPAMLSSASSQPAATRPWWRFW